MRVVVPEKTWTLFLKTGWASTQGLVSVRRNSLLFNQKLHKLRQLLRLGPKQRLDLDAWGAQGVFLPVCYPGVRDSDSVNDKMLDMIRHVFRLLNDKHTGLVFLLQGKFLCGLLRPLIDRKKHFVIEAFQTQNQLFVLQGKPPGKRVHAPRLEVAGGRTRGAV